MKNKQNTSDYILETSREYSLYVCENRAVPKVTDGLKDSQRKALWVIRNKQEKIKTVSLGGELISSNLYLHGDQSAAAAISMLAAPFCNNIPLLDGIGAFGTRVAPVEGIGAPRYTYVKRGKAAQNLVYNDLQIVPLKENYDGSTMEPVNFLPLIPMVLLNGVSGIAVGWSTEILPRSFADLVQATIQALDGKPVQQLVPSYDYLNCAVSHLEHNTWELSGKAEIVNTSTIKITELPPDLTLERFKERLNGMEETNSINSYVDRSTKVIDITIKMPRGSIGDWDEAKVVEFFKLKQKKTERIVVIDWNGSSIRQYDKAEELVSDFVAWRLNWFTTRYEKMLADDNQELSYWRAVEACFKHNLPARLGAKNNRQEVEEDILKIVQKENISLENKQLDRIVNLPTYRWAKDFLTTVKNNIEELKGNVSLYSDILADPQMLKSIYRDELLALKKMF